MRSETEPSGAVVGSAMLAIVVIWGLGQPVTKVITAPPLVTTAVRLWLSTPILLALLAVTGRRLDAAVMRKTALAGLALASNLVLVFVALEHASVTVVSIVLAVQPGMVVVVAGRWLGERATTWHKAWTAVAVAGVVVVVIGGDPAIAGDALGLGCSILSMLTFTGYYLINRWGRSVLPVDPLTWLTATTLGAAIFITPAVLIASSVDDLRLLDGEDWLAVEFMVIVVGIAGHGLMSWAHRYVAASRSSLYLLGMNVVAILAAWPLHSEPVSLVQAIGGVIVLCAVAAVVARPGSVVVDRTALVSVIGSELGEVENGAGAVGARSDRQR